MSKVIIVDENDNPISLKERGSIAKNDIYRVTALWLTNSQGDILLAQRAFTKKNHPGLWGPAVAGTVEEGETYESNMVKEIEEEIGLKDVSLKKSIYELRDGNHKHFTQWFELVIDKELSAFIIQEDEVVQIKWFTRNEIKQELQKNSEKFLPAMREVLDKFK